MQHRNRGTGASVQPEATPRAPYARRPIIEHAATFRGISFKAAVAAVLGTAALAGPAMAQEAVGPVEPPSPGHAITVFPERNMVVADGYRNEQSVTIDVLRNGESIGTTTATADGDDPATDALEGFVEVNHPGGACWTGTSPDIRPGDRIVATSEGAADATTVAYVGAGDYARYVKDGTTPRRDENGNYLIRMAGTALKPDGTTYPADQLEARLVNAERFSNQKRTVRAAATPGGDGTLTYDALTGDWTADWWLSEADAAKAVDAEPRIMWLGTDPGVGNELTIFEFGVADDGCGAGGEPDPYAIGNFMPPAPLGVSDPPQNGRVIDVFPSRDFIALAGFTGAGEKVKVEVFRSTKDAMTGEVQTQLVGLAGNLKPNAAGDIEINHPGGACWETSETMPFPDLRPHDQVRATAYGPAGQIVDVSQTTIADVMIRTRTTVTGAGNIRVEGDVHLPDGSPWPAARADELEVRLRSKDFLPFTGKQDLRVDAASAPTDTMTIDENGHFVATFRDKSEDVQRIALDPDTEQRIMWLGADPATGAEATLFERGSGVVGGPGGCDLPPGPGDPVRDEPIITPPGPDAPPQVGPQADGSILVPGIGGLTTVRGPDGRPVLAAQVDAQSLAKLARTGVVSVVLEQKARPDGVLYRFKIRRAGGGTGRAASVAAAAPQGKAIATFWRAAPKKAGKFRFNLRSSALRGLKPGRYVVDVTAANARKKTSGKTLSVSFRVR